VTAKEFIANLRSPDQEGFGRIDPIKPGSDNIDRLAQLDQLANVIRTWEPTVVPGNLQIPSYSAAVIREAHPFMSAMAVQERVQLKQQRAQAFLRRTRSAYLRSTWIVLGERAIRSAVSLDEHTHLAQLQHLLSLSQTERFTIQVLGDDVIVPGLSDNFSLYTLDDESKVGYAETPFGPCYTTREEHLRDAHIRFGNIRSAAMQPNETRKYIEGVLQSWRTQSLESPASTTDGSSSSAPTAIRETTVSERLDSKR
jgi:hypothetical protein